MSSLGRLRRDVDRQVQALTGEPNLIAAIRKGKLNMANDLTIYEQQWAVQATEMAVNERVTGALTFSTRAGALMLGEERMPGDQVCVIILDFFRLNTYYGNDFDQDNPMPPVCYAVGKTEEELGPHHTMQADLSYFRPQNDPTLPGACHSCALNQWGSSDRGRGKACQNRRELILLPAGFYQPRQRSRDFDLNLIDDPVHYQTADTARLRLPVTSVNNWARFVNMVSGQFRRPPAGVITRVYLEADQKTQYKVNFEVVEAVPDALAAVVIQRQQQSMQVQHPGFAPPEAESVRQPRGNGQQRQSLRR